MNNSTTLNIDGILSCIVQLRCMEEIVGKVVDEVTRQAAL